MRFPAAVLALGALLYSCAGAPHAGSAGGNASRDQSRLSGKGDTGKGEVSTQSAASGGGTPLTVPSREELGKNAADQAVTALLELGTPGSLRAAVERVHADSRGMTDKNRVYLALAGELMKILYPLESVDWQMPSIPDGNPWMQAVRSARMGVYDYNTGNADFLAQVLPSLVLYINPSNRDFYPDAKASLSAAAARNPKSGLPELFLGLIAEREGDIAASADRYRAAWNLDQGCYPAGQGLVRTLLALRDGSAAFPVAKALLERYPQDLGMVKLCAESSFAAGLWEQADPYVLQVLKAESANSGYLLMRARILVERSDYLKANSLLDAYATVDKTNRDYLVLKARVVREWNKNPLSAAAIVEDADRRYPNDPVIMLAAADLAYQTGKTVNGLTGREYVERILAQEPRNKGALTLSAEDYIAAGRWSDALSASAALVQVDSGIPSLSVRLRALIGGGRFPEALTLSSRLYEADPASPQTVSWRLEALIGAGDTAGASALIASLLPEAPALVKSRLFYYKSSLESDSEARLAALRSSLLSDPRNGDALFAMYSLYYGRKDWRKAQYYLKQVIAISPGTPRYEKLLSELDLLLAQ